jgi:RimJ/RimL family protein N-acetyltransferase
MHIEFDHFVIRNAVADDAETLCNWWNDGKVMAHAGFPNGLGTTPQKIMQDLAANTDEDHRCLIIELDSIPIGEMSCKNVGNRTVAIEIKICDFEKQDMGIGTKVLKMLVHSLFVDMGYEKIILDTNLTNTRAQKVYEKIGFRKVATNYNSWKNQMGEMQSSVGYELTRTEYLDKYER